MRIAFFGGTFDPPHCGHLAIARAAADRLHLDQVWFAPVGLQPLKQESSVASFEDRVAMVRLAIAGDRRFEVSTEDAPRQNGRPNYTIDTVMELKESLAPEDRLFCLIGADSFLTLPRWHRAVDLLFLCDFIVAGRPGFDLQDATTALPESVRVTRSSNSTADLTQLELTNGSSLHSCIYLLPDLQEEVSATEIRAAFAGHANARDVLSDKVAEYIRAQGLYR